MDGQFNLFDKASKISASKNLKNDLNSYKSALDSQTQYMNDYADNYAAVAAAVKATDASAGGVGDSFMAQLADGSEESAHGTDRRSAWA